MANFWENDLPADIGAPFAPGPARPGDGEVPFWANDLPADAAPAQAAAPASVAGATRADDQFSLMRLVGQGLSGVNEGIADIASLPSTAFNLISQVGPWAWNAVTGDNVKPAVVAPDTGAPIREGMEAAGMITPEDPGEGRQFARRVGREVGASLVPVLGTAGGSAANVARGLASAAGSGVGAATAQQIAPDSVGAEIAGSLIGSAVPLAAYDRLQRLGADRAARAAVPTVEQLKSQAGDLYEQGARTGATAPQADVAGLASDLRATAQAEGLISPTGRVSEAYPKAREAIRMMDDAAGDMNPRQMQTIRKTLSDAAGSADPAERRMATKFLKQFDTFAERYVPQFAEARPLYTRAMRGEQLEKLREVADAGASTYSQAGAENALRTQYRNLDKAIQRGSERGFPPELQAAIRRVNEGSPAANAARYVGKLAPKGVVSLALAPGAAFGIGNMLGGPAVGAAASGLTAATGFASADLARRLTSGAASEAELLARAGGAIRPAGGLLAGPSASTVAGAVSGIAAGTTAERDRRRKRRRKARTGEGEADEQGYRPPALALP